MPITSTGLVSGINADSIISQIQDAERKPIAQLQARQSGYQGQISALLALSNTLSTFAAVATSVNNPANFNTRTAGVTKTPAGVSVLSATAGSTATNGSYSLTVQQLAQAQKKASQGFVDQNTTAVASGAGTFKFKVGNSGTEYSATVSSSTTLQGLRDAINSSGGSVVATIINDGTGSNPYRLVLTANSSGADNTITITNNNSTLDFTNAAIISGFTVPARAIVSRGPSPRTPETTTRARPIRRSWSKRSPAERLTRRRTNFRSMAESPIWVSVAWPITPLLSPAPPAPASSRRPV